METPQPENVGLCGRIWGVGKYLWLERCGFLIAALVCILAVLYLFGFPNPSKDWDTWDQMITILTLAVGVAVFLNEATETWESRLPKRLNVFFSVNGQTCMVCYGAHLVHEGDVRGLSQQIGRQISKEHLELCPRIDFKRLGIVRSAGEVVALFEAVIYLKRVPAPKEERGGVGTRPTEGLAARLRDYAESHEGETGCVVLWVESDCELPERIEAASAHRPRHR